MKRYFFKWALLPEGWCQDVRAVVNAGRFVSVDIFQDRQEEDQAEDECHDVVIPAMPNAHSHVFQRAMAGLSEYKTKESDSFWSWRELMYRLANQISADELYDLAKSVYQDMLNAGYSAVCEFHYVHRDLEDNTNALKMSKAVMQAAHDVGLPMTMLPVLYAFSAVGDAPLNPEQQRFELSADEYIKLSKQLSSVKFPEQRVGICFHSIRAVNKTLMQKVIKSLPRNMPIHIHIAEQQAEINQSVDFHGKRPVQWLYDNFDVDGRWSLVHATHLDQKEKALIAKSKAVAVLCPLTEANLGDGVFDMPSLIAQQGVWAIGSDSHIELNPAQELKMLEYSQRLIQQQRNVCCDRNQPHVGTWLWLHAVAGGAQASGLDISGIEKGSHARVLSLIPQDKMIDVSYYENLLDAYVFSDHVKGCSVIM